MKNSFEIERICSCLETIVSRQAQTIEKLAIALCQQRQAPVQEQEQVVQAPVASVVAPAPNDAPDSIMTHVPNRTFQASISKDDIDKAKSDGKIHRKWNVSKNGKKLSVFTTQVCACAKTKPSKDGKQFMACEKHGDSYDTSSKSKNHYATLQQAIAFDSDYPSRDKKQSVEPASKEPVEPVQATTSKDSVEAVEPVEIPEKLDIYCYWSVTDEKNPSQITTNLSVPFSLFSDGEDITTTKAGKNRINICANPKVFACENKKGQTFVVSNELKSEGKPSSLEQELVRFWSKLELLVGHPILVTYHYEKTT